MMLGTRERKNLNEHCSYDDLEKGMTYNNCEDNEIITYCKKCGCVYAVNQDDGTRTELNLTIKELLDFIHEKEKEGYTE